MTIVAIIAAYNEEDIAGQAVEYLIREGLQVYFIDHGSTDGTVAVVEPFVGRGVIGIEVAPDLGGSRENGYAWRAILRRKQELAGQIDADWFIHHDADEFREGPWRDLSLLESIRRVDALGYNAIDFELLNFWPTHDNFKPGDDVREAFRFYELGGQFDKLQVKCWKKPAVPIDLESKAGHDVLFDGRRVFPLRFLLRHYPIRGQAHGERKVYRERLGRFAQAERAGGWHIQYDGLAGRTSFLRDPCTLTPYDADATRLHVLLNRLEEIDPLVEENDRLQKEIDRVQKEIDRLPKEIDRLQKEIDRLQTSVDEERRRSESLTADVQVIRSSRSWRWTAPLRAVIDRWQRPDRPRR